MRTYHKKYYTCSGEVRGPCGTKHQSLEAAEKCLDRDQSRCKTHNGTTDRVIMFFDGIVLEPVEIKDAV